MFYAKEISRLFWCWLIGWLVGCRRMIIFLTRDFFQYRNRDRDHNRDRDRDQFQISYFTA